MMIGNVANTALPSVMREVHLEGFPYQEALKLLINPGEQLGSGRGDSLGDNLVQNPNFEDFTMEDDANTKGHWIFDDIYDAQEGGSGIEKDLSGNGNDLTPQNFETDFEGSLTGDNPAYKDGNALQFDGVDQYLEIPAVDATDFNPGTGDFTIEMWIKSGKNLDYNYLYSKAFASGYVKFFQSNDGSLRAILNDGTNTGDVSGGDIDDGGWHHVAFVVDRDVGAYLYVDGVNVATEETTEWTDMSASDLTGGNDLYVGRESSNYFNGQIAEIRYSNKARTAEEIVRSYAIARGWWVITSNIVAGDNDYKNDNWSQQFAEPPGESSGDIGQSLTGLDTTALYRIDVKIKTSAAQNLAVLFMGTIIRPVSSFSDTDYTVLVYYNKPANSNGNLQFLVYDGARYATINYVRVSKVATKTPTSTIKDYSKQGNDGTWQNSVEDDQPAHPEAIRLNGVDQYGDFGNVLDVSSNDFILFVLTKNDNTSMAASDVLFSKKPAAGFDLRYLVTSDIVQGSINDGTDAVFNGTTDVADGNWHLVVAVIDRGNDLGKIYVDGSDDSNTTDISAVTGSLDNAGNFIVGATNTPGLYWRGFFGIAGIMIFDGQNGAPSSLPADYEDSIVKPLYRWIKANIKDAGEEI